MPSVTQRNFSAGEIDPKLFSRVDQTKYTTGLKKLRNAYVMKGGGLESRPGTEFIAEVKDSDKSVRLISYILSSDAAFILEFGEEYIRFYKNGSQVLETAQNITAITNANPGVFTSAAHGLVVGEEVYVAGILGMTEFNGRNFKVNTTPTVNTFTLAYMDGTPVDTTAFGVYVSGGTFQTVYEIVTPYQEADLDRINFAQNVDVMTLVHPSYIPYNLTRITDTNWQLSLSSFEPNFVSTAVYAFTAGAAGAVVNNYLVTSISRDTGEESLPVIVNPATVDTVTSITNAFPAVLTAAAHGVVNGAYVLLTVSYASGMFELNKRLFRVQNVTANTMELVGLDTSGMSPFVASGTNTIRQVSNAATSATPTVGTPNLISIFPDSEAIEYNVYKEVNGVFGLIGITNGVFRDTGQDPDTSISPPSGSYVFSYANNYPSTVAYSKQRLLFGGTNDSPEEIQGSAIGEFGDFYRKSPIQDDSPVKFRMAGNRVNPIRHIVEVGRPIVLTATGEWTLNGNGTGLITPGEVNPEQRSYNGSDYLRPLIVNGDVIYLQARGSVVRDLLFDFQIDGYRGNELSIFSNHLVEKNTIVDWDFQLIPNSIVWAVRNDGKLLSLTNLREQAVLGWAVHDFGDDLVENVSSIPGSDQDDVYLVVNRTIDGVSKRYIEKFATRKIIDIIDNIFLDSAISYDGFNTTATTMTLSGAAYTDADLLDCTSSAPFFVPSDVGNEIHFFDSDRNNIIRFEITNYVSATNVEGYSNIDVPVSLQNISSVYWGKAVDQLSNLYHLEGREVSIFADRVVAASPYNSSYDPALTVINGQVTLDKCYTMIHVGLPFVVDIETLEVDSPSGQTLMDKNKNISKVTGRFHETRGVFIGSQEPTGADLLDGLDQLKLRDNEDYGQPTDLLSGKAELNIRPQWDNFGRVFIRQVDPLPISLLSITGEGLFKLGGGS